MNPPSKYQGLFLTPRSPNGKRLQMRTLRRHMHASEDKVPDPTSKEMQGLGGQMVPNKLVSNNLVPNTQPLRPLGSLASQMEPHDVRTAAADSEIVRKPGYVAPSMSEQLHNEYEWNRQQGYYNPSDLSVQQKTERDNFLRDTFPSKPEPQQEGALKKALHHVSAAVRGEGAIPGEKNGTVQIQISTNPKQRGEIPSPGAPEKDEGDEENYKYLHPEE